MADTIRFRWQDADVTVGMSQAGSGRSVVLLPALSSISTRGEMQPLLERLAPSCCVTSLDWPGFGDLPRPRVDWTPDLLSAFLNWVLDEVLTPPHAVVAAGHAGTYALYQAVHHPATIEDLVLIAPTWRGPLPTMMGGQRSWFARVRGAVDNPLIGPSLYRLNVSRPVIRRMAREHVYDDPEWLSGERMAAKRAVTRAAGAACLGAICQWRPRPGGEPGGVSRPGAACRGTDPDGLRQRGAPAITGGDGRTGRIAQRGCSAAASRQAGRSRGVPGGGRDGRGVAPLGVSLPLATSAGACHDLARARPARARHGDYCVIALTIWSVL